MNKKISIVDDTEILNRKDKLDEFLQSVIDPEEQPYVVTNEASVYDITLEEDIEVIKKIKKKYGVELSTD